MKEPKSAMPISCLPEINNETTAPCDTLSMVSNQIDELKPAEDDALSDPETSVWMKSSKGRNRKRSVKCK